ncbi:TIGR03084 family metal-binding protein [Streptomyces venezuelae]|nr:TIGR03084 family metal-binding protein [Streptomyces venezuelae]
MSDPVVVLDDLRDESDELDRLVAELSEERWAAPTPAAGWTIAHQIAHLAWTDRAAFLAATDAQAFAAETEKALAAPDRFVDEGAEEGAKLPPAELLAGWRAGRERLQDALRAVPAGARFPWYGPPMSAPAMATARLMETWAHGQDVADALGVVRTPTARLRHVAWIGHRARDYAFLVRGLPVPAEPVRVEITAADGELWTYGPEGAAQRVTGPALDFCLLVTQRVHRADTALVAEGADADRWLDIAQAFAGPAGPGRTTKEAAGPGRMDEEAPGRTAKEAAGPGRTAEEAADSGPTATETPDRTTTQTPGPTATETPVRTAKEAP